MEKDMKLRIGNVKQQGLFCFKNKKNVLFLYNYVSFI